MIASLRKSAGPEDEGTSLEPSIAMVLSQGSIWHGDGRGDCRRLIAIAEANLPVARIVEGHINACALLARLAPEHLAPDAVYGVWGADGAAPLHFTNDGLAGGKKYASGLGVVTDALVTVAVDDGVRLAVVDVREPARHRPGTWKMQGMRATVSGGRRPDRYAVCVGWRH